MTKRKMTSNSIVSAKVTENNEDSKDAAMAQLRLAESDLVQKQENQLIADYALHKALEDHKIEMETIRQLQNELQNRLEGSRKLHAIVSEMDKLAQVARTEKREAELLVEQLKFNDATSSGAKLNEAHAVLISRATKRVRQDEEEEDDGQAASPQTFAPIVDKLIQEISFDTSDKRAFVRIKDVGSLRILYDRLKNRLPVKRLAGRAYRSSIYDLDDIQRMIESGELSVERKLQYSQAAHDRICTLCCGTIPIGSEVVCPTSCTHAYHVSCLAFCESIIKPGQEFVCLAKSNSFITGIGKGCKPHKRKDPK